MSLVLGVAEGETQASWIEASQVSSIRTKSDPGHGLDLDVRTSASVPLIISGSGELTLLADPHFAGQSLTLFASEVSPSATRDIQAVSPLDEEGNYVLSFTSYRDVAELIAIEVAPGLLRWQVVASEGVTRRATPPEPGQLSRVAWVLDLYQKLDAYDGTSQAAEDYAAGFDANTGTFTFGNNPTQQGTSDIKDYIVGFFSFLSDDGNGISHYEVVRAHEVGDTVWLESKVRYKVLNEPESDPNAVDPVTGEFVWPHLPATTRLTFNPDTGLLASVAVYADTTPIFDRYFEVN